jgi:predicted secreted Zn-dependent protease
MQSFKKSLLSTRFVFRPFSTFTQLKTEAAQIKDYNVREYFMRRIDYDETTGQTFTSEQMKERFEQLERIRAVQNLYHVQPSIIETKMK